MEFIVIQTPEGADSHIDNPTGNYATLCGMDGDDDHYSVEQEVTGAAKTVTCKACISVWEAARAVPPRFIAGS